jgi:tripartite ATP-independent transporter DctP family solute receptor
MKIRTRITTLAACLVTAAATFTGVAHAKPDVTLKLAHVQPETHAFHKGSVKFAETLKEVSGGKMEVQIFPNGVMGNERDLLEALQIGSLDLVTVTSALTSKFSTNYQVFSLPFLFDSYQDAFRVMDDPEIRGSLGEKLIGKGIRPIAYWIGGARSYYGRSEVENLPDFKGKKVRTMEDPYYLATWKSLGAIPTPLPFGEVYSALQTGLVDGAEGAINTYVSKKFYESAPHVAMVNYVYSIQPLHIAESRWKKLSEQQREWVMQAADASATYERQIILDEDRKMNDTLASHGVQVTRPEIGPLREAVAPVYEKFRKEFGDEAYSLVEQIRKD